MAPRARLLFAALAASFLGLAPAARAQFTFMESGFGAQFLDPGYSKQIQLSAGPDSCVYAAVDTKLIRKCPGGSFTDFATGFGFPVGIEFGWGGAWGSLVYVGDNGGAGVYRVGLGGTPALFATITGVGALAFPPAGSPYGDYLYVPTAFSGPLYRVNSAGSVTSWIPLATCYLKFGPGGAWGTGMYATRYGFGEGDLVTVASDGTVTPFTGGMSIPEGFDWGFDGDMFACDLSTGDIWRVHSNGTKSVFANLPGAADVAFRPSEQALYVSSYYGGVYRVAPGTVGVEDGPRALTAPRVAPNPARGECTLTFGLREGGVTRVSVLDLSGRVVRTLASSWRPAGEQSLRWDGRDDRGVALPPGNYFARVSVGGETRGLRVTRVR